MKKILFVLVKTSVAGPCCTAPIKYSPFRIDYADRTGVYLVFGRALCKNSYHHCLKPLPEGEKTSPSDLEINQTSYTSQIMFLDREERT